MDSDKVKVSLSVKLCNRLGPMCQFCKQLAQHPSPQESDWMGGDWTENKPKTETNRGDRPYVRLGLALTSIKP